MELDCKKQLGSINFKNRRKPVAVRRNEVEEMFGRDRIAPMGRIESTRYRSREGQGERTRNNNHCDIAQDDNDIIVSAVPGDYNGRRA